MSRRFFYCLLYVLLVTACVDPMQQNNSEVFESHQKLFDIITKVSVESITEGISESDVEHYLYFRCNITPKEIESIIRYEFDLNVYIYIVNLFDGHWFIISGDSSSGPIISSGDTGGFNIDMDKPMTRHNRIWFESIKNLIVSNRNSFEENVKESRTEWMRSQRVAMLRDRSHMKKLRNEDPDTMEVDIQTIIDTLIYENYPSLTVTEWWQGDPWNNAIPKFDNNDRCYAGCAVIAIAQLLYYTHYAFGYPNDLYSNASCNSYYYDDNYYWTFSNPSTTSWDNMSTEFYNPYTYTDPYMPALCALIAKRSNTRYGYEPSEFFDYRDTYGDTSVDSVANTLSSFMLAGVSYQNYYSSTTPDIIMNEIRNQRPVLCTGAHGVNSTVGHAFLIDGFYRYKTREIEIIRDMQGNILSQETYIYDYFFWRINTGEKYPYNRVNDLVWNSSYYSNGRIIFIGWGQS